MKPARDELLALYRRLRAAQGVQCWWPGETSFEVVVGCILTQNTNWNNVVRSISSLDQAGVLNPSAILALPDDRLVELIRPSGFSSQKPGRLKRLCQWWLKHFGDGVYPLVSYDEHKWGEGSGRLAIPDFGFPIPAMETFRSELVLVNGVGPETADAILLYALGLPSFVVDAYTRRITSRLGLTQEKIGYERLRELFQKSLPSDVPLFNDFHAQFVALAKRNCRKIPICQTCPLRHECRHAIADHPDRG